MLKKLHEFTVFPGKEKERMMTKEELAAFDGQSGRKAYVAVNGKVFDVTASRYWQDGNHQNAHQAGTDLSADLLKAPHVRSVIERFPVVAVLEEAPPDEVKGTGGKVGNIIAALLVAGFLVWLLLR
jgi:predicted heme/steroid binding protein